MTELFKKNNKKEKNRFFWRKSQKIILLILLIYLSLGFYQIAEAQSAILGLGSAALRFVLNLLTFAIGAFHWFVGAVLFKFAGLTLNFAFNVNLNLLSDLNENHFILIGWTIFRDLANLGFVFGIIVIAVATILRFKSYTYQTLLPKFIAAALLVNFSLVIASSIISLSDVFSNFFISSSSNGSIDALARKIVDKSMVIRIIEGGPSEEEENLMIESIPDQSEINEIKKKDESGLSIVFYEFGGVLVSTLVMFFVFITLLAMALYLILRYFNLAFLLILSPIVWILWVFPATSGYWKKWWQSFIHWVFMPPLILFFINITLVFLSGSDGGFGSRAKEVVSSAQSGSIAGIGFENLMLPLMAGALLLGGLKISQTMGFAGASFVLNRAETWGKRVSGWAKGKAKRAGYRVARVPGKGIGKAGEWIAKKTAGSKIAKWTGLHALARGGVAVGALAERKAAESFEYARKKYSKYDKKRLQSIAGAVSGVEKQAVVSLLQERDWLDKETIARLGGKREILKMKSDYEKWGKGKEFGEIEKSFGVSAKIQDKIDEAASKLSKGAITFNKAVEDLSEATREFVSKLSDADWRKVGKGLFGRNPDEMADLSDGERAYLASVAKEINQDTSGKRFYRVASRLEGEQMYEYAATLYMNLENLLPGVDRHFVATELNKARNAYKTGNRDQALEIYSNLVQKIVDEFKANSKTLTPEQKRLYERIKKSIISDALGSAYGGPPPSSAPSAGGGGGAAGGGAAGGGAGGGSTP